VADHTWLDELKAALLDSGTTQDDLLNAVLTNVEGAIEDYTGLVIFDPGADVTEYQDGTGTRKLYLDLAPIKSITTLHVDSSRTWAAAYLADSDSYIVDTGTRGSEVRMVYDQDAAISFSKFPCGDDNIRVVYRPGWTAGAEPAGLRRAALMWAAYAFKVWDSKTHAIKAKNMADGSVTFFERQPPPEVALLLAQWIRLPQP